MKHADKYEKKEITAQQILNSAKSRRRKKLIEVRHAIANQCARTRQEQVYKLTLGVFATTTLGTCRRQNEKRERERKTVKRIQSMLCNRLLLKQIKMIEMS